MSATTLEATPPPARGPLLRGLPWITWRQHRLELPVEAVVDVTLAPARAWIRHRMRFQFTQAPPRREAFVQAPCSEGNLSH